MMRGHIRGGKGPPLPLPALHLLAPPMRLASAALWHSVQHRVVAHYGMLEEFVTMVTDIIPGLLNPKQRAQLILGLQAQLVLELCRSEPVADPLTIQTHLDRMQTLTPLWGAEATDAEVGFSGSNFLSLIETLQREPEERQHFFQDVFPVEFGKKYDAAIQTLMWQFLSRLEKTLQVPDFQEVASLLSEDPSALEKGVELLSLTPELRALLEHHSDPILLDQDDAQATLDDDCILSALCLPPVERVVIVSEQTETGASSRAEPSVKTEDVEMDTDPRVSENERERREESSAEEHSNDIRLLAITEEQEVEEDGEVAVMRVDDMKPDCGDPVTGGQKEVGDHDSNMETVSETVMVVREDGTLMPLDVLDRRPQNHPGKSRIKAKTMGTTPTVTLERLDISNMAVPPPSRSVRWNKGLKMKKFIELERKAAEQEPSGRKSQKTNTKYSRAKSKEGTKMTRSQMKHLRRSKSFFCPYSGESNPGPEDKPYWCDMCGNRFLVRSSVTRHIKLGRCLADGEPSSLKCPVCKYLSPDASQLEMHMMSHVKKRLFQCSNCERAFRDKYAWSAHQLVCLFASQQRGELVSGETSEGPAVIPKDPQPSNTPEPPNMAQSSSPGALGLQRDSVRRVSEEEAMKKQLRCDECGKEFAYKATLKAHKLTHNELCCVECKKVFPDAETLARHVLAHKPVKCTMCDKRFHVIAVLSKHYLDVHGFSGPFACSHCPKRYAAVGALVRHERIHTGELPYRCSQCSRGFNTRSQLDAHERRHSGGKRFLCWECGKTYNTNLFLRKHMERHHSANAKKPHQCPECDHAFWRKSHIEKHMKEHHKGLKFPCSLCGKLLCNASSLARHMLIHSEVKPFSCSYQDCNKVFRSKIELTIHTRYHTGERPFKCQHCGKGFLQSNHATIHELTHTQERPHVCNICGRAFNTRNTLNRHCRVHTGERPYQCPDCGEAFKRGHHLKAHKQTHHSES